MFVKQSGAGQQHQENQYFQQQLQQKDQQICHKDQEIRQRDLEIFHKDQDIHHKDQEIHHKDQEICCKNQEIGQKEQEIHMKEQQLLQQKQQIYQLHREINVLQQQVDVLQKPTWTINKGDIRVLDKKLGTGGWGSVSEAIFRGCRVAVKSLDHNIISRYNLGLFCREMNMAARCRHPNLMQFIGATDEGIPLIVTEIMHTSLRRLLEQDRLQSTQIVPISLGVAYGLNYLHKTTPDPILHRDVSSANVLLNPLPNNQWHPKLSDFGSTNFMRASNTISSGNPTYAAPEALSNQGPHTPAMDVFSFGILMFEMCAREFPAQQPNQFTLNHVRWGPTEASLIGIIRSCLAEDYQRRPVMEDFISGLNHRV